MNLNKLRRKFHRFFYGVKKLPQGKHHLDFVAALLTIPVLLSVIVLNYSNLQSLKNKPTPSPTQIQTPIIVVPSQKESNNPTPTSSTCIKDIGSVAISYPEDQDTITDNPVCVIINYSNSNYCSVVWSYRINNGTWSDYNSNNPCIYNLPNGNIKFDLRVQSTVTQKQQNLTRSFIYKNLSATPSGGLQ